VGRKVGLTLDQVTDAAMVIADEHRDATAVTPTAVATLLGVKTPSLYAHVDGATGLRRLTSRRAHALLASTLRSAVSVTDAPAEQLRRICHAYRNFAHDHPGLYDALLPAPTASDDPEGAAMALDAVATIAAPLSALELDPSEHIDHIRWMRALLHGFVDLELRGGFALADPIERSFAHAVDQIVATLAHH
jgi:hypothetical protein